MSEIYKEQMSLVKGISILCANRNDNLIIFQKLYINEYLKQIARDALGRQIKPDCFEKIIDDFNMSDQHESIFIHNEDMFTDFIEGVFEDHPEYFNKIFSNIGNDNPV